MADEPAAQDLAAALRQLAEASRAAREAMRELLLSMTLVGLGLASWDAEMDNCYPNWPAD